MHFQHNNQKNCYTVITVTSNTYFCKYLGVSVSLYVCMLHVYECTFALYNNILFQRAGTGAHPAWHQRVERERGGDGEAVGDLSLQIGTTETFPNRMWLWFLTSFHSQLSDRFLLRWHLLHNDAQKCGTAQKWGSCCPTCKAVSVTSSPPPLSCDSTTLTTTITTTKLKPQPCKWCTASVPPYCSPTLASLSASLSPSSRDPFISDVSASWFYLCDTLTQTFTEQLH